MPGGGALTARRAGEQAGVKFQLVHYYCTSMDDLVLELLQRGSERSLREFARLSGEALSSARRGGGRRRTSTIRESRIRALRGLKCSPP